MEECRRHAPALECPVEVKSQLLAICASRTEEVRKVERARIILACLEGKEIQQVAYESGASVPTVSKWRRRFAQQGLEGLRDRPRSGKPARYGAVFRDRVLARSACGLGVSAPIRSLPRKQPRWWDCI